MHTIAKNLIPFLLILILPTLANAKGGIEGFLWTYNGDSYSSPSQAGDVGCENWNVSFSETSPSHCLRHFKTENSTEDRYRFGYKLNGASDITGAGTVKRVACLSEDTLESCQVGYIDPESDCPDGYPLDAYGNGCDRPPIKPCNDTYILTTEFCTQPSPVCTDFDSCLDWSVQNTACQSNDDILFNYQDNSNFQVSCTAQQAEEDTPPSLSCDGIVCGEDPAPLTPPDDGTVGGDDGTDGGDDGTDGGDDGTDDGDDGTGGGDDGTGGDGDCDPTALNYLSCLGGTQSDMPDKLEIKTSDDVNALVYDSIANAPIVLSFNNMSELIKLDTNASCPPFSIDFPSPISKTVSTNIHCTLMNTVSPIISPIMLIVYLWGAFRIFASS